MTGFEVDEVAAEVDHGQVVLEKLREIEGPSSLVALLIEIVRPHPVLVLLEVRGHLHDVVIGSHVSKQADEAALVELNELLGEPYFVEVLAGKEIIDEVVSGHPDDMLFDERFSVDVEVNFVG